MGETLRLAMLAYRDLVVFFELKSVNFFFTRPNCIKPMLPVWSKSSAL